MSFGNQFEVAMREFAALGGFVMTRDRVVIAAVRHGDTVEFASAVCAPNDKFIEAVGMAIAVERFMAEQTVILPCYMADFM